MASEKTSAAQPGFDEVLGSLKQVVDRLESGQLTLEAALGAFEEGVGLARQGAQILDAAERRVEILTQGPDGPTVPSVPSVSDFETPQ